MTLCHTLDELVVVSVLKPRLQSVVIYVSHRQFRLYFVHVHRLQLKVNHRTGGILRQRLIDADFDFLAGL